MERRKTIVTGTVGERGGEGGEEERRRSRG